MMNHLGITEFNEFCKCWQRYDTYKHSSTMRSFLFFTSLLLFTLFFGVSATLQENVLASIEKIAHAFSESKVSFCFLLACVMQNYALMLYCKKLLDEGSDESPEFLSTSKTTKSWHDYLISIKKDFISYHFFT